LAATPHFVEVSLLAAAGMLDGARERRRICEEFRLIEGQLLRQAFDAMSGPDGEPGPPAGNLMMVTSAREGEGKSFTALNLATGIARQRDRDVLLIDADAKVASLGERLGLAKLPGLLDLAADPALVADRLLVPTGLERLHILPIGQRIDGAAEAFGARQMARRLRELASAMPDRLVIIDTPPCLLSSAASALASLVGQCVLVVQAERTAPREVEAAADLLQSCPAVLLLLNQVRLSNRHGFGAGPYGRYDRDA
jgi:receptor protein-tyrosine kinase